MNRKIFGALTFLVGIAIALGFWLRQDAPSTTDVFSGGAPVRSDDGNRKSKFDQKPTEVPATAATRKVSSRQTEFSQSFFDSINLGDFLTHAADAPEKGSYFYAEMALLECQNSAFAIQSAEKSPPVLVGDRRNKLVERFKTRCRNVEDPTNAGARMRRLGADGLTSKDAGFGFSAPMAYRGPSAMNQPSADKIAAQLITGLYFSGDALVTQNVAIRMASMSDGLIVTGRQMTPIEQASLSAAILLVSCDLGVPCDLTHPILQRECLLKGNCDFVNLEEFSQRATYKDWDSFTQITQYDFRTALELREQLLTSIASGTVLLAKRAP